MKPINIVLIILLIIILINITSPTIPSNVALSSTHTPKNVVTVGEEDILIENRGDPIKVMDDFPIPQTTTRHKSLSPEKPIDLSIVNNGSTINNPDVIMEVRSDNNPLTPDSHFPKYYLKDNLSANTMGSSEYKFAEVDNLKSSHAWSDLNVSQYPNYYTSQIKDEITNVGAFFDVNNNFVDASKPRSTANVGDICFVSREGEKVCLDNDRLHNIPPSLISNKNNCGFLNSIGLLEFSNMIYEDKERVNNGGNLYGNVKGSKNHNETYSEPLQQPVLSCQI